MALQVPIPLFVEQLHVTPGRVTKAAGEMEPVLVTDRSHLLRGLVRAPKLVLQCAMIVDGVAGGHVRVEKGPAQLEMDLAQQFRPASRGRWTALVAGDGLGASGRLVVAQLRIANDALVENVVIAEPLERIRSLEAAPDYFRVVGGDNETLGGLGGGATLNESGLCQAVVA